MPATPAARAARANYLKSTLIAFLGGRCVVCGSTKQLEPNHIWQRTWKVNRLTHYRRVLRYWQEAKLGLLDARCPACNRAYRPPPMPPEVVARVEGQQDPTGCPF